MREVERPSIAPTAALIAIAAGIALRLIWPGVIEFKADERWTFDQVQAILGGGTWPAFGMPTSMGPANPGLSIWLFALLGFVFGADNPPALARAVQIVDSAALIAMWAVIRRVVPSDDREPWYWALALYAVNPFAVLLERKIWPPSLVPPFIVLFLLGWWRRERAWGAALWGAAGVAAAQLHLAAGLLSAVVALATAWRDGGRVSWRGWFVGSALAGLPLLPWLFAVAPALADGPRGGWRWRVPNATYFTRWATQPLGLGIDYALGEGLPTFLAAPRVAGLSLYGVLALHAALALAGVAIVARAVAAWWRGAIGWRALGDGGGGDAPLIAAALWMMGSVLTLSTLNVHRHYLSVATLMPCLWIARLALIGAGAEMRARMRGLLAAVILLQAVLSLALLAHLRAAGGAPGIGAEFGITWEAQQRAAPPAPR